MKCFVTGVSRGIGHAVAAELLRRGHTVWGLSRTLAPDLAEADHARFRHSTCDLADEDSRRVLSNQMDVEQYVPDAVILNAGVEYEEASSMFSWDKMQTVLRTNVEGSLAWVAHWMDRHPRPPMQFIGISTLLALWPDSACPAYCTSKAALSMAFRALRLRYAKEPVSFKLLYLGPVHTSINPRFTQGSAPGRGVASPERVACHLVDNVLPARGFSFYYPWPVGLVCRLGNWMPDKLFESLTRPLRR